MPGIPVNYQPAPYVRDNSLGQLLRMQGQNRANAELQRGSIAAQLWANLGNQLSQTIQGYAQERQQAPIRAQEAEARAIQIQNAKYDQAARQQQAESASILQSAQSSRMAPDQVRAQLQELGRGDLVPVFDKTWSELETARLGLQKAKMEVQALESDYFGAMAAGIKAANYEPMAVQWALSEAEADGHDVTAIKQQLDQNPQGKVDSLIQQSPTQRKLMGEEADRKLERDQETRAGMEAMERIAATNRDDRRQSEALAETMRHNRATEAAAALPTQDPQGGVAAPLDPTSQDLMSQAGLTYNGFLTLTGRMSQLPRDRATRAQASAEVAAWARERGMDVSTLASQYKAYNEALESNIERYNRTLLAEGEIASSVTNLIGAAKDSGLNDVRAINAAKQWLKGELNDPNAAQYAFFLNQLVNDIALYNAASQGRAALQADMEDAKSVVQRGVAAGSLTGMQKAITQSVEKMGTVLEGSVNRSRKNVWELFGVGDKYRPKTAAVVKMRAPNGAVKDVPVNEVDHYKSLGAVLVSQ